MMSDRCRPIRESEIALLRTDARHATRALVTRMLDEIEQTRRLIREIDTSYGEYSDIAYASPDSDYATMAWESFTKDLYRLTDLTRQWGRDGDAP